MAKRANRKPNSSDGGISDLEIESLKAENLHLKEEIERLRLRNAGAHPAGALADALRSSDEAGDSADDAMTMYTSSMVIKSELLDLLRLFKHTIAEFELRLERLGEDDLELSESPSAVELREAVETSLSALDGGRTHAALEVDEDAAAQPAAKGA